MTKKKMLLVDDPASCEKCDCCANTLGKHICPPKGTYVMKGERDCSCPLRDIPEPLPYSEDKGMANASYIQGWNDCLKALMG